MEHNSKQFTITLSERQLRLLAYACRVTDRLIIGQLNFSLQECCEAAFENLYKGKDAGKLSFKPSCPRGLLEDQRAYMANYIVALEQRAFSEGIKLDD